MLSRRGDPFSKRDADRGSWCPSRRPESKTIRGNNSRRVLTVRFLSCVKENTWSPTEKSRQPKGPKETGVSVRDRMLKLPTKRHGGFIRRVRVRGVGERSRGWERVKADLVQLSTKGLSNDR